MKKIFLPLAIFVVSFVYYAFQACQTFYFWDPAELTAAVLGDGVPHPPGFPALLLLGKLWAALMPLDRAFSLNIMSAFFASIGLTFWFQVSRLFFRKVHPEKKLAIIEILSLLSVIILGISFSFSIQAVRFEVYSFNFACFAILAYLAFRVSMASNSISLSRWIMFTLVAVAALSGHHFTIALTFPGLLLLMYLHRRFALKHLIYFLAAVLLLLIPLYSYIYFLARNNPMLNWGAPYNWHNFIDYFFLKEFSMPGSNLAPARLAQNLGFAVEIIFRQTGVLGFILGLWGIVRLIRIFPRTAFPLLLILLLNIFSIVFFEDFFYANYDQHGYLLFSVALFALFAAMSTGLLTDFLIARLWPKFKTISGKVEIISTVIVAAIVLIGPAKKNLFSADLSGTTAARDFAAMFLDGLPDNSVFISSSYNSYFCLLAYRSMEKAERTVYVTNVYNWDHQWGREETASFLGFDPSGTTGRPDFYRDLLNSIKDKRQVFIEFDKASAPLINYLKPSGLSYKLAISDTTAIDVDSAAAEIEYYYEVAKKSRDDLESIRTWVLWFMNRGQFYMQRGEKNLANRYFEMAEKIGSLADIK